LIIQNKQEQFIILIHHLADRRLGALGVRMHSLSCARRPAVGTLIRIGQTSYHPNLLVPKYVNSIGFIAHTNLT